MLPHTLKDQKVHIIGLGYVGLTLAVAMADAGFRIHGVEINPEVLESLENKKAHFWEAGLDSHIARQIDDGRFTFGKDFAEEDGFSTFIVTVGTPIGSEKKTVSANLLSVTKAIAQRLKDGDQIILRSTVKVGTTRDIVNPILEATGKSYDLCFCPERTLEGKALAELTSLPQVVGGMTDSATFRASSMFSFLTPSVVRVRNPETAEMVKLINNTQRDYMFAFANEVAAMCDSIGVSAKEVIAGGNLGYPRANLPLPGPVGGPCLEKDPYILAEGLASGGFDPALSLAAREWNETLPQRTGQAIASLHASRATQSPTKIAVIGLAFKGRPQTDDLRGTLAKPLVEELKNCFPDSKLIGWDPLVNAEGTESLDLVPVESLEAAFTDTDIVVIQNNHEVFQQMDLRSLTDRMNRPGIIYDLWGQHDPFHLSTASGTSYHALGAHDLSINS